MELFYLPQKVRLFQHEVRADAQAVFHLSDAFQLVRAHGSKLC